MTNQIRGESHRGSVYGEGEVAEGATNSGASAGNYARINFEAL